MDNIVIKRMKKDYMEELLGELKYTAYTYIEGEEDNYNLEIYSVIGVAMKLMKKVSNKQIKEAYKEFIADHKDFERVVICKN